MDQYDVDVSFFMPGQEGMTLLSLQSDGSFMNYTAPNVRRCPARKNDSLIAGGLIGETWWVLEVYNAQLLPVVPKIGDQLQDTSGVVYTVRTIEVKLFGTNYRCGVIQNK